MLHFYPIKWTPDNGTNYPDTLAIRILKDQMFYPVKKAIRKIKYRALGFVNRKFHLDNKAMTSFSDEISG